MPRGRDVRPRSQVKALSEGLDAWMAFVVYDVKPKRGGNAQTGRVPAEAEDSRSVASASEMIWHI